MYRILAQLFLALTLVCSAINPQDHPSASISILPLNSVDELEIHSAKLDAVEAPNAAAEISSYLGRRAVKLVNKAGVTPAGQPANGETIAILKGSDFKDGTIEAEVVGFPGGGGQRRRTDILGRPYRGASQRE